MSNIMKPTRALVGAVIVTNVACGARVVVDLPPDDEILLNDGGSGAPDADVDAEIMLLSCESTSDCYGTATCQEGHCCNGTFSNDSCACGDIASGCDLQHVCCIPIEGGPNGKQACIPSAFVLSKCYSGFP